MRPRAALGGAAAAGEVRAGGYLSGRPEPFGAAHLLARYLMVPLLVVWWAAAIRCYLRMPHAWAVAVVMPVLALLVLAALVGAALTSS